MTRGSYSKIQRYSTKDGPGLRSTVFLIGCDLECVWCSNPELIKKGRKILFHPELCNQCGACIPVSNGAITMGEKAVVIDRDACDNLAECAAACYYDAFEILGQKITSADLARKLLRDKAFYDQSGGGVTFSGGEPGMQAKFVMETAALLRAEGVHVALDTAGLLSWSKLKPLADSVDLVLYDVKAFDPEIHKACTGVGNKRILHNARKLAAAGQEMHVRMVIAPGYNDQPEDLDARLQFVHSLGASVTRLDILKLHHLGVGKYHSLGMACATEGGPDCPDDLADEILEKAKALGLPATIGG